MEVQDYREFANSNKSIFLRILRHYQLNHGCKTVDEIYEKYSTGDRYRKWTIYNFYKKDDSYYIHVGDVGTLSGYRKTDKFDLDDRKIVYTETTMRIRY